jgi:hypothetical protein
MKRNLQLPIPVDPEIKNMIEEAAQKTHLSQAAVMRLALRLGTPEVVKRFETSRPPRRNFAEYLGIFAGIVQRNQELVGPSNTGCSWAEFAQRGPARTQAAEIKRPARRLAESESTVL